jgi:NAD(P)-dependent dehydrogenase (short-subunit alcohol dehydrogenase family)
MEAVVVTGASSGIGAATAELLARSGFIAFAGVRKDADAQKIGAIHPNLRPLRIDVTDAAMIGAAADMVARSGLSVRGVVNNAGIAVGGPLEFLPLDMLRRQFEVNVVGQIAVAQAFLPQLRASHGRIVFVGSVSGRLAVPFIGAYSGSKFALRAMTDALRLELADAGVKVSLVEPANVKTPIWSKGRASRDELLRRLGPKAAEHYARQLDEVFRRLDRSERTGMPVARVSEAILHALTARKPKTHYMLGSRLASVIGSLPAPVYDRVIRSAMRR